MKSTINTIIFDFGDVLVQDKSKVLEKEYDFDSMTKANQQKYIRAFHQSETGHIPTRKLLEVIHQTLAPDLGTKQIEEYIIKSKLLPPWKLALRLKRQGYKIIIFSNNQRTWPKKFAKALKADFLQFPFINSAGIGIRKPHENIYRYLLKKYKINPTQAIFIDDRSKNLPPAKKLGISVFHYQHNYRDLIAFLKKNGLKGL
jgi:putative hydrolase of the HAD superfamily